MSDEVSQRFTSALAIHDDDSPSFGVMRSFPAPQQFFVVGRLLTLKSKIPDLKAVIGTLTFLWDLHNRLQMRAMADYFVLRFIGADDWKNILTGDLCSILLSMIGWKIWLLFRLIPSLSRSKSKVFQMRL
ncbi:hypothetical protein ACLB2K_032814 [Fragaria x ananassa]